MTDPTPQQKEPDGLRAAIEALRSAFSGDEFEENAAAAAGEGEWSWFRWLAVTTIEGLAAHPATDQPEAVVCTCPPLGPTSAHCPLCGTTDRGEVGTGAGEVAPRQDTGSAWVTRSADCPEAPAQAHLPATDQPEVDRG